MTNLQKKILAVGVGILVGVVVILAFLYWPKNQLGHGGPFESINYQAFSTSTLTGAYTGAGSVSSSIILAGGLPNIAIAGKYTPKSYGSIAEILVERSLDHGATFEPYVTISPESADTLVNTSGTGTTNGSPFLVPGNALYLSASGTTIGYSFDLTLVADYIRVSAKEVTTSTAGTLNTQVLLTSN